MYTIDSDSEEDNGFLITHLDSMDLQMCMPTIHGVATDGDKINLDITHGDTTHGVMDGTLVLQVDSMVEPTAMAGVVEMDGTMVIMVEIHMQLVIQEVQDIMVQELVEAQAVAQEVEPMVLDL